MTKSEKAIRWVQQHAFTDKCEASDTALAALRAVQADRWIPVSERLPETGEVVLIYKPTWVYPIIARLREDGVFTVGQGTALEATHWRPLPAWPDEEK